MKLVDANVLLYAVNSDSRHHTEARRWLDDSLSGRGTVAFAWLALLAFLRLSTKPEIFPAPLDVAAAMDTVDAWLSAPPAVVLQPGVGHARLVRSLLADIGSGGNLVNDAHLAALALEHRCTLVSYDRDFGRFEGLSWTTPGEAA